MAELSTFESGGKSKSTDFKTERIDRKKSLNFLCALQGLHS